MKKIKFLILIFHLGYCNGIELSLGNSIVGDPIVECGTDSILVGFRTEKTFNGRLYVEGESDKPGCSKHPTGNGPVVDFRIRFGDCNMRRQRTLSPRGVSFSLTVVASFHPLFVTGLDRAFHIRCFFTEAVKAVESNIDVAKMTTQLVERQFVLPQCNYQLRNGFNGPPLRFASVGDSVTHVWQCDELAGLVYGILIHSCFVDDGHGNKFVLLDDRGCAVDAFLLGNLQYDSHAIGAHVDSHVFKYADRVQLFFTCTVQLCFKDDGGCEGITPPRCGPHDSAVAPGLRPPPPVFPLWPDDFQKPSEDQETLSNGRLPDFVETKFPEERYSEKSDPSKNEDFFGPIRTGHPRAFSIGRKEASRNPFGAAGFEISPFGSPFKDSPLANETDTELENSESLVDAIRNLTDINTDPKTKRKNRATKQMESDVTVELTVMPIENESPPTNGVETSRISPRKHCFSIPTLVILMFGSLASMFLSSVITALIIGNRCWQRTKELC